jgi:hypothetical protein
VLKLEQFRNVDERLAEMDTGGLGVSFAVLTPVGLLVEGGTESYGHFDFFDSDDEFVLRQDYLALGYQFELGDGWYLVPKAGFGKRVTHVMSLGASVRSGDYDFGDAGSVAFVMTFSF